MSPTKSITYAGFGECVDEVPSAPTSAARSNSPGDSARDASPQRESLRRVESFERSEDPHKIVSSIRGIEPGIEAGAVEGYPAF
jgi:hypothetical protein